MITHFQGGSMDQFQHMKVEATIRVHDPHNFDNMVAISNSRIVNYWELAQFFEPVEAFLNVSPRSQGYQYWTIEYTFKTIS